jgi:hypothetical protein
LITVLLWLVGCHRHLPEGAVLLSSVVADASPQRLAAQWEMPVADVQGFVDSSPQRCPAPTSILTASACLHVPPTHGLSLETPLAWGPVPEDGLWHGRLRCGSGATPRIAGEHPGLWWVQCPEDAHPVAWFVDVQAACGNPCPPQGMTVMPADAWNLERLVAQALEERRTGDALQLAGMGVDRFPQHASAWQGLGMSRAATGNHAGALEAFTHAQQLDPGDDWIAYCALRAAHSASMWSETVTRAQLLQPRLSEPDMVAEVMCMEGIARTRLGEASGAAVSAAACAAGALGCCGPTSTQLQP